jgi:tRNA pseudouridine55 synthase
MSFVGEYSQVPPMYSAIKVNGKKLYELARQGKEVPRQPRQVFIYEIDILKVNIPEVTFRVKCSKGTYIRSLCRDIGEKLGCGGLMKSLIRTEVKGYRLADSMRLSEIESARDEGTLESHIVPIDHILKNMPKLFVANDMADKLLLNGNKLKPSYLKNEADGDLSSIIEACSRFCDDEEKSDITTAQSMVRIYDRKNNFTGIYRYDIEEKLFVPFKMFL